MLRHFPNRNRFSSQWIIRRHFQERQGFVRPKEIVYREELPEKLRQPSLTSCGVRSTGLFSGSASRRCSILTGLMTGRRRSADNNIQEEENLDFIAAKRVLLACEWYRLYDLIEDLFGHLDFHDTGLRNEDEEFQAYPFQQSLNQYSTTPASAGSSWTARSSRAAMKPFSVRCRLLRPS
jgi:hypothetical protein